MAPAERRRASRLPVAFYVTRIAREEPERCFTSSLSVSGVYVEDVVDTGPGRAPLPDVVQIELALPGEDDTLWARGELIREARGPLFHGAAVRFTAMANRHRRRLADWLRARRRAVHATEVVQDGPVAIIRPA